MLMDGGYIRAACCMFPEHNRVFLEDVLFSEWLESVRLDLYFQSNSLLNA